MSEVSFHVSDECQVDDLLTFHVQLQGWQYFLEYVGSVAVGLSPG